MADLEAPARAAHAASQGRRGDWMQTASGKMFWPLDPRPEEVDIHDIAHSLALQCRYMGNCQYHYSIAQHSVYVAAMVPREHRLVALLHDATEAYCGDVVRPLKRYLVNYEVIEQRIWQAIAQRFGVPVELPACVKQADNDVLLAEKAQIMLPSPAEWGVPGTAAPIKIDPWTPRHARHEFLANFHILTDGHA